MLWSAGLSNLGCKDKCIGSGLINRCDGDVWVHCAGGWMTFAWEPDRDDCRDRGQRCVGPPAPGSPMVGCQAPLGPCEPATFTARCDPYEPTASGEKSGRMTQCIAGEELAAGDSCTVLSAAAPIATMARPAGSNRP